MGRRSNTYMRSRWRSTAWGMIHHIPVLVIPSAGHRLLMRMHRTVAISFSTIDVHGSARHKDYDQTQGRKEEMTLTMPRPPTDAHTDAVYTNLPSTTVLNRSFLSWRAELQTADQPCNSM